MAIIFADDGDSTHVKHRNDIDKMTLLLGIDIGGTKSAVVAGTSAGEVLARREWPSRADRGPEPMLREIEENARELLRVHPDICAVGVSIGGPLDAERGIIYEPPNLPGWKAIPLKQRLQASLGLPVNIEHDAAACALAESQWGAGQGCQRVIYLTCGTGFGAGIVIDGAAYYGAGGCSPEIGHWRYADDGPEAYGKRGSVEAFCSGSGLSKLAAWQFPARWSDSPPSGAQLAALAREGDEEARQILIMNAQAVGSVCARLADLFRPDSIILGSLARYLGEEWLNWVREPFLTESLPNTAAGIKLTQSGLGDRLQDCSALAAALAST